ncbi:MAG: bifunctional ornithine acetyltransferase/N-acetylglutamate synthase, partial [Gemmatimonadetes bacterium]|nr:bifunctional ornithine acetyltransferase/N-acetylglutamate synthase [Gemmatimonadota bacterium]
MTPPAEAVESGTITSPKGFSAGATFAGLKTPGPGKLDLGLLFSELPCTAAGVFSQNSVVSPSVTLSRQTVREGGAVRGIVVNSGCANCSVGEQGLTDAREVAALAASHLEVKPEEMLICSTGVIGVELPMGIIREHMPAIRLRDDGGHDLARAIVTTDTRTKERAVQVRIGRRVVTVGGIAKGAGMIHPNMATMLCFMATDAAVERGFLQKVLYDAARVSFNQVDVDGDQSTNDTMLLLANGAAGNEPLAGGDAGSEAFAAAVTDVAQYLAKEIARDGEGANCLIEVRVDGAK